MRPAGDRLRPLGVDLVTWDGAGNFGGWNERGAYSVRSVGVCLLGRAWEIRLGVPGWMIRRASEDRNLGMDGWALYRFWRGRWEIHRVYSSWLSAALGRYEEERAKIAARRAATP